MITPQHLSIPAIDLAVPPILQTATFSMGCFWGPEALFGCVEGVVRTRVGYAGGTTPTPTYRTIADHIETVQVEYDPTLLDYGQLLHLFFSNHTATRAPYKRQYASAIFCHNPEQVKLAREALQKLEQQEGSPLYTMVYPYMQLYLAEDRHQKYRLQRQRALLQELKAMYPDFSGIIHSTAAARVNGYVAGHGNIEKLREEIGSFGLSPKGQRLLLEKAAASGAIK